MRACVSEERGDGEGAGTAGSQVLSLLRYTEIYQSHRLSHKTHQRLGWDAAKTDEPVCMCERGVWEGE